MLAALKTATLICTLTSMGVSHYKAKRLTPVILKESKRRHITPSLVISIIKRESRFRSRLKSRTHDYGLMGIHCPTKTYSWWCKKPKRLYRDRFNIYVGVKILAHKRRACRKMKDWLRCYNYFSRSYAKNTRKLQEKIKKKIINCQHLQIRKSR